MSARYQSLVIAVYSSELQYTVSSSITHTMYTCTCTRVV